MNNNAIVATLFTAYRDDSKDRLTIYCQCLKDIPTELLKKAVMKCITKYKFMPAVAEVLEECQSLTDTITGKPKHKPWDEAWEEIYQGWVDGGAYKPQPEWSTPEIAHVIKCFGWLSLLETPADQTMAIRAQMKTMYEMACKRNLTRESNENILKGKSGFESIGAAMTALMKGKGNE